MNETQIFKEILKSNKAKNLKQLGEVKPSPSKQNDYDNQSYYKTYYSSDDEDNDTNMTFQNKRQKLAESESSSREEDSRAVIKANRKGRTLYRDHKSYSS